MKRPRHAFEIHRIMVALDSSSHAASALEAGAMLAAQLNAELEGLFVQDINLVRLAGLPVGREIQFLTGKGRDYTAEALAAQYREEEVSARKAIAAAAARARISFAFRVAQGQVEAEVISAAGNADLLILGMGHPSPGGRRRLGTTARAAAERAPRSVLISRGNIKSISSPLVCYDGSDGAKRALDAAVRLAGVHGKVITILIIAPDLDRAGMLREDIADRLTHVERAPNFLHNGQPSPDQLCRFAAESGADVLVIGADSGFLSAADKVRILEEIACPVMLVR